MCAFYPSPAPAYAGAPSSPREEGINFNVESFGYNKMTSYLITLIACLLTYLFGSLSSAILVCKLMKLPDPRTQGSRNPGATNVLRIGGRKAALITLLGDMLKGVVPVLIAKWYGLETLTVGLVMLAAILGH